MAGKVEFKIEGLKEVEAALRQLGPELAEQAGDNALRAMAKPIIEEAQRLAPVDTGKYRDNIGLALDRKKGGDTERVAHIGVRSPWSRLAHLLEFGHRTRNGSQVAPQPHLRTALDSRVNDAITAGGAALARNLRTVTDKLAKGKQVRRVR